MCFFSYSNEDKFLFLMNKLGYDYKKIMPDYTMYIDKWGNFKINETNDGVDYYGFHGDKKYIPTIEEKQE